MDNIERQEIRNLITKYSCQKDSEIILNHLCNSNRINKAALERSGYKDNNINAMVTRLKLALQPYGEM